jgi:hypothetical protein
LRRNRKTGVSPPRLHDKAAKSSDFALKTRQVKPILAKDMAKNAKKRARLSGTWLRGLSPTAKPEKTRLPPDSVRLAAPKPGNSR